MFKSPKNKIILFFCILYMFMLSACSILKNKDEKLEAPLNPPPRIDLFKTIDVKRSTLEDTITLKGLVYSNNQKTLAFRDKGGVIKAIYVKVGKEVNKGDLLAELDTDHLQSEIQQQGIVLRLQQLDYEKEKYMKTTDTYELARLKLLVDVEKVKLDNLKKQYNNAKIYAPFSGEITYLDAASVGDYIPPGKPYIIISDPTQLLIRCKGEQIDSFPIGAKVTVVITDIKKRTGYVVSSPSSMPEDANEDVKDTVDIKVVDIPKDTYINASVNVSLVTKKRENAIVIDKTMVTTFYNKNYVYIAQNGVKVRKDVELGLQVGGLVEVVKGLNVGDKIIYWSQSF